MKKKLLLASALFLSTVAFAETITVTNANAEGDGSLAQALANAQKNDVIEFNVDADTIAWNDVVDLIFTIDGLNKHNGERIVLEGNGKRFFNLAGGDYGTLKNLVLDGKDIPGTIGITSAFESTLTIENCVFKNISSQAGANNGGVGRIQGALTVKNCLFENNSCKGGYGGGALCIYNEAVVTIESSSFIGNTSLFEAAEGAVNRSGGGAIVVRGTKDKAAKLTLTNCTFANNFSSAYGGAILTSVQSSSKFKAELRAVNCTFSGNTGGAAIDLHANVNGDIKGYLVNSIVLNNIDSLNVNTDICETLEADATAEIATELYNVIYSNVSESITVPADRNCIKIVNPNEADVFKTLEDFSAEITKKRPAISEVDGVKVIELSKISEAKEAGVAEQTGFRIPTTDQLGNERPATPSVGAVEPEKEEESFVKNPSSNSVQIVVDGRQFSVLGANAGTSVQIFNIAGALVKEITLAANGAVSMSDVAGNLFIVRVANQNFKLVLK